MADEKDLLKKLFVDEDQVNNEKVLFDMVSPYTLISEQTGGLIPKDEYFPLQIIQKILLFLLVKKILYLEKKAETDHIKAKDIVNEMEIPKGSILPNLKRLREMGLVSNSPEGYYVTGYQIAKINSKKILKINEKK